MTSGRRPPGKSQTSSRFLELGDRRPNWPAQLAQPAQLAGWVRTTPPGKVQLGVHPGQIGMGSPGRRPFLPGKVGLRYATLRTKLRYVSLFGQNYATELRYAIFCYITELQFFFNKRNCLFNITCVFFFLEKMRSIAIKLYK